jgi:hypothetical protein
MKEKIQKRNDSQYKQLQRRKKKKIPSDSLAKSAKSSISSFSLAEISGIVLLTTIESIGILLGTSIISKVSKSCEFESEALRNGSCCVLLPSIKANCSWTLI